MDTFKVQFNEGVAGGSLVFTIGKGRDDAYPIYVPVNRQVSDWDLTETFYPDLAEMMTDLERKDEVFSKIYLFPNKLNGRSMVIHHTSSTVAPQREQVERSSPSRFKELGRLIQTLQIEEVHGEKRLRLKHSYTFYVTPTFVKEYRVAMKKLHTFLTSGMRVAPTPPILLQSEKDFHQELVKVLSERRQEAFEETGFPPATGGWMASEKTKPPSATGGREDDFREAVKTIFFQQNYTPPGAGAGAGAGPGLFRFSDEEEEEEDAISFDPDELEFESECGGFEEVEDDASCDQHDPLWGVDADLLGDVDVVYGDDF